MPSIPTITSRVSAATGRSNASIPTRGPSADAFGAPMGEALQRLGAGADRLVEGGQVFLERREKEELANRVAQSDYTRRELELRNAAPADGAGYQETVLADYDAFVDEQANLIEDDRTRKAFRETMASQKPTLSSRSAQYEFGAAAENSKLQANNSLTALDNQIRMQPDNYDNLISQGNAVIDARPGLTQGLREGMKTSWRQSAARARVDGLLASATSVDDIDRIEQDITGKAGRDWTSEFSQTDLDATLNTISTARSTFATKADADARAAIETVEARAKDPSTLIPPEELTAVQSVVSQSKNPVTQARFARVLRDQDIVRETRTLTAEQQRMRLNADRNRPTLPARVNTAINEGAQAFGISPAYLAGAAQKEYGGLFKVDEQGNDITDYGVKASTSSATGVMQHIDDTFLSVMKTPGVSQVIGVDLAGMSDQQILALRGNERISVMAGAALAAQNGRAIQAVTGKPATDAELYMAHFLGAGGAATLLRGRQNTPDAIAADTFPAQAAANKSIFYEGDRPRTMAELYNRLGGGFSTGTNYVEYGDRETRQAILTRTETQIKNDPMSHAEETGVYRITPLDAPGGIEARGQEARAVADYYSIPAADIKPFKQEEVADLSRQLQDGDADQALQLISAIQGMGGDTARAGLRQLGEDNSVYAYAGRLQMETGQGGVAGDIIRGQKRREENPDIKQATGASNEDMMLAFDNTVGTSLYGIAPRDRQEIYDAALSHYTETTVARGGGGAFDAKKFEVSVQAVMGATQGSPIIGEVNGTKTVLPPGLDGETVETAMQEMTLADWTVMSATGTPPLYATGAQVDPQDIADEASLQAIGGGEYKVQLSDGSFLITGEVEATGRLAAYIFRPDAGRMNAIVAEANEMRSSARQGVTLRNAARPQQSPSAPPPVDPYVQTPYDPSEVLGD